MEEEKVCPMNDFKPLQVEDSNKNVSILSNTQFRDESQVLAISPYVADEAPKTTSVTRRSRKRKRGVNGEDVCFVCYDGGEIVECTMKSCPKSYHPACTGLEESYLQNSKDWKCSWHICNQCEKSAHYMCYTCPYSLCKGCFKATDFFRYNTNKGLCKICKKRVEKNKQGNNASDGFFRDYWIDLKIKPLQSEKFTLALNKIEGDQVNTGSSLEHPEVSRLKRRKVRKCSKSSFLEGSSSDTREGDEDGTSIIRDRKWACKDLLDFVAHMKNGDTSVLSYFDVRSLLLEYIARNNLRDSHQESLIQCDSRLENLFGKAYIGHFEMFGHLRSLLMNKDTEEDCIQAISFDTRPCQTVTNGNSDPHKKVVADIVVKMGKSSAYDDDYAPNVIHFKANGKRKPLVKASADQGLGLRKMGEHKSPQTNLDRAVIDTQLPTAHKRKTLKKVGAYKRPNFRRKGEVEHRSLQTNLDDYASVDVHNIKLLYLQRSLLEFMLEDMDKFHDKVVGSFVRITMDSSEKQEMHRLVQVVGTGRVLDECKTGKKTTDVTLKILNMNKTVFIPIDSISNEEFSEEECRCLCESIKSGLANQMTVREAREKAMILQEVRVDKSLEREKSRLCSARDWAREKGIKQKLKECNEKLQRLNTERSLRVQEIPEIHAEPNTNPSGRSQENVESDDKRQGNTMPHTVIESNLEGRKPISPEKSGSVSNNTCSGGRENLITGSEPSTNEVPECDLDREDVPKVWHYQDPSGKIQGPFSMLQLCKWSTTSSFPANLRIWRATGSCEDSILLIDALNNTFSH